MIIQDDIIKADDGKSLLYTPEKKVWGKSARLAMYKGHQLTKEDFVEIDDSNVAEIGGVGYYLVGKSYAEIKTFVIKLKYSNDDQIAIMLNGDDSKMQEMQEWREYASSIAKKYTEKQ